MAGPHRLCNAHGRMAVDGINVLLVDDHAACRRDVRAMLADSPAIRVIGEAADGDEALRALDREVPDVAVLDLDMPGMDGLALARAIRERHLPIRLILLTVHRKESLIRRALASGIDGYVAKDAALLELANGITAVYGGQTYVSAPFSRLGGNGSRSSRF